MKEDRDHTMSERQQIIYMQARILRLAAEKWNKSIESVAELFVKYGVLQYIEECFGIFHVEGDETILEDIAAYLESRGGMRHAEIGE